MAAATEPKTEVLSYANAVNAALHRALEAYPEALFFGEDVALPGGVFGCSKGLQTRFPTRVFDTPISESAILGAAVGASLLGRRPIVEIMWIDFSLVALDQLINQAANVRYVSRGELTAPLTVRTQQGALPGSCAQHSQCLEAVFAHVPGLRVGLPATPHDAYAMLLSAIAEDDPVVIVEQRGAYHTLSGPVDLNGPVEAIGGARVLRAGNDVTLVSWGTMLSRALAAAEAAATDRISVEVIDPRWLNPLDIETILTSVEKTSRIVIAHEANLTGGFGAEVSARVAREGFWSLDAPIERVGAPDTRIPAAPTLQSAVLPSADTISTAIRRVTQG
jgi:pyruvate dehydrogenase E1 component beta subunit